MDLHGYIFSDLNWNDPLSGILGVSLSTDVDGLDSSRVNFGADFVAVNFSALLLDADDTFFELVMDVGPVSVVPVPAAVWLFGTGILGLIGFSKRKKAA